MALDSNIDTFKSMMSRRSGMAKSNRYAVFINLPLIATSPSTLLTNLISGNRNPMQLFNDPRDIGMMAEIAALPGRTIQTAEYQTNMKARKMPQGYIADDITITFLLTGDMYIKNAMEQWQSRLIDTSRKVAKYKKDGVSDIMIQTLNQQNNPSYTVKLKNAFPVSISQVDLGNTNENTISRLSVTFAYDDWTQDNLSGALLGAGQRLIEKFF